MYNKNTQNICHQFLADSFNRKKTKKDDISRFQNIHSKIAPIQHFNLTKEKNIEDIDSEKEDLLLFKEDIYKMNDIKISNNISLNFEKEDIYSKIPKIQFKEIIIPYQNMHDTYDLNSINKNISVPVYMNMFIGDEFNEGDVSRLKKKQVSTIYHVYQTKYNDNTNVTGFGDFIRGCFFTLQFCKRHQFICKILINHPISIFLKNGNSSSLYRKLYNTLFFTQSNLKDTIFNRNNNNIENFILAGKTSVDFVEYLCRLKIFNHSIFSYSTLFPYDNISDEECEIVKTLLEPSDEMEQYIDEAMTEYGIFKKQYIVIHVRSGDAYLKNETKIFNSHYFNTLTSDIFNIINEYGNNGNGMNDFLLISDNNEIKYLLHENFPMIKISYKDITHLGEGIELEKEKVKNTLIDFYLISNASHIFSFTVYPHGTGFSYWCSKVYNIPYTCKYIKI